MKKFTLFLLFTAMLGALAVVNKPPEKITWSATECTLSWNGTDGVDYKIDFHKGTMSGADKEYPIARGEKDYGHEAFNYMITKYILNFEVWFKKGGVYNRPMPPPEADTPIKLQWTPVGQ